MCERHELPVQRMRTSGAINHFDGAQQQQPGSRTPQQAGIASSAPYSTDTTARLNKLVNSQAATLMHEFGHILEIEDRMQHGARFFFFAGFKIQHGHFLVGTEADDTAVAMLR